MLVRWSAQMEFLNSSSAALLEGALSGTASDYGHIMRMIVYDCTGGDQTSSQMHCLHISPRACSLSCLAGAVAAGRRNQ